jgi:hypothetical protein
MALRGPVVVTLAGSTLTKRQCGIAADEPCDNSWTLALTWVLSHYAQVVLTLTDSWFGSLSMLLSMACLCPSTIKLTLTLDGDC